jgi:predicted nucleic acid-binding protein
VTFVDTSALLAFLDRDTDRHDEVVAAMAPLLAERRGVTHNYVVVEAEALVTRRLGGAVARRMLQDVIPLIEVAWITPELHARAVESHLADLRRRTSLVDHASFVVMRERGIGEALALDRHFSEAGFAVKP